MTEQSFLIYSILLFTMTICGVISSMRVNSKALFLTTTTKSSFWSVEIIIPIALFSILFGMRYDVGVDHLSYLNSYVQIDIPEKIEPLFAQITHLCTQMGFHFSVYFGLLAFIQIFFFYYAFNEEKYLYPYLAFILIANMEWMFWMNVIRQAIAMCIWIYSLKFIEHKKLFLYLFWGIIAYLFHRSAFILFFFYPLLRNGKDYFRSTSLQLILFASTFILRQFFEILINRMTVLVDFYISLIGTDIYENSYNIEELQESFRLQTGTGLAAIFRIFVNIIIILYSKKMKLFYNSNRFTIIYFFYFFSVITLYIFPAGYISFTRPFRFFYIFQSIMIAYYLFFLYKNKTLQNITIYWGLIFVFFGILYLKIYTAGNDESFLYQFFFQAN